MSGVMLFMKEYGTWVMVAGTFLVLCMVKCSTGWTWAEVIRSALTGRRKP